MKTACLVRCPVPILCGLLLGCLVLPVGSEDFKQELFGEPVRVGAFIQEQNSNGYVQLNGGAMNLAAEPMWDFGDGIVAASWFPAEHTYSSTASNYIVTLTVRFTDGKTNTIQLLVRFTPPALNPIGLPTNLAVSIPETRVALESRMPGYGFSESLSAFDDSFFNTNLPRSAVEYILTVAASVQCEMVRSNMFLVDGGFRQLVLRDPLFGGMYSIWYSTPVAFGAGNQGFDGAPGYSSFFHEMGHNFTLNFPASYYYGGKTDGNANAIYSETMAQIIQHATAYEVLNLASEYGLPPDLAFDIRQSARDSIAIVRASYERYVASGCHFASWNDPATPEDETFDTFMTLAYTFFVHAENAGGGYAVPVRRMTRLLGTFDAGLHQRYDPGNDSVNGDAFRATLMIAALSYAFDADLRGECRGLHFPVDDGAYAELMSRLSPPSLGIARTSPEGSTVGISWPVTPAEWDLQHRTNLTSSAGWTRITAGIVDDGVLKTLTLTPEPGQHFYRLIER